MKNEIATPPCARPQGTLDDLASHHWGGEAGGRGDDFLTMRTPAGDYPLEEHLTPGRGRR